MLISKKSLIELVDTPLDPGMSLYRLHRYYCTPMTYSSNCTENCQDCKEHLQDVFRGTRAAKVARDPYAILVWHLRNKVAQIQEKKEEPVQRVDWLGQPIDENPFEALLKELAKLG